MGKADEEAIQREIRGQSSYISQRQKSRAETERPTTGIDFSADEAQIVTRQKRDLASRVEVDPRVDTEEEEGEDVGRGSGHLVSRQAYADDDRDRPVERRPEMERQVDGRQSAILTKFLRPGATCTATTDSGNVDGVEHRVSASARVDEIIKRKREEQRIKAGVAKLNSSDSSSYYCSASSMPDRLEEEDSSGFYFDSLKTEKYSRKTEAAAAAKSEKVLFEDEDDELFRQVTVPEKTKETRQLRLAQYVADTKEVRPDVPTSFNDRLTRFLPGRGAQAQDLPLVSPKQKYQEKKKEIAATERDRLAKYLPATSSMPSDHKVAEQKHPQANVALGAIPKAAQPEVLEPQNEGNKTVSVPTVKESAPAKKLRILAQLRKERQADKQNISKNDKPGVNPIQDAVTAVSSSSDSDFARRTFRSSVTSSK